ncbi:MAG: hypothetical protein OHK0022_43210 [Roseiflexaceae bacterium]
MRSKIAMCWWCQHLHSEKAKYGLSRYCDAFPESIPDVILESYFDHRAAYPGDNGIRFSLASFDILKERKMFRNAEDLQKRVDFIHLMFQEFDEDRVKGLMQPPLGESASTSNVED